MKLVEMIKTFAADEDGAVTVDWVVLTAAVVLLGMIVLSAIRPAAQNLSETIASKMDEQNAALVAQSVQ